MPTHENLLQFSDQKSNFLAWSQTSLMNFCLSIQNSDGKHGKHRDIIKICFPLVSMSFPDLHTFRHPSAEVDFIQQNSLIFKHRCVIHFSISKQKRKINQEISITQLFRPKGRLLAEVDFIQQNSLIFKQRSFIHFSTNKRMWKIAMKYRLLLFVVLRANFQQKCIFSREIP